MKMRYGMGRIYNNITELVGNTPLVRLNRVNDTHATVVAKLDSSTRPAV